MHHCKQVHCIEKCLFNLIFYELPTMHLEMQTKKPIEEYNGKLEASTS